MNQNQEPKDTTKNIEKAIPAVKASISSEKGLNQKSSKKPLLTSKNIDKKSGNKSNYRFGRKGKWKKKRSPYEEKVIAINRVSKTTKGGRRMSFNALVVIGDKKSQVGFAIAKGAEVPLAIKKAIFQAQKNLITPPKTKNNTIPHSIIGKSGSSKVFLKNAQEGTGIIAGSAARVVLELAGIKNIYSKIFGSHTPANVVQATFNALSRLKTKASVAQLRDIDIKEL